MSPYLRIVTREVQIVFFIKLNESANSYTGDRRIQWKYWSCKRTSEKRRRTEPSSGHELHGESEDDPPWGGHHPPPVMSLRLRININVF